VALDPLADFEWSESGILERTGSTWSTCVWPTKRRAVTATVTHGYDPVPVALKDVTLAAARRRFTNTGGVKSQTTGPFAVTYELALFPEEETVIDLYRLPSRP
jgi:hypothetical protein